MSKLARGLAASNVCEEEVDVVPVGRPGEVQGREDGPVIRDVEAIVFDEDADDEVGGGAGVVSLRVKRRSTKRLAPRIEMSLSRDRM
jgi:hypothetical protein